MNRPSGGIVLVPIVRKPVRSGFVDILNQHQDFIFSTARENRSIEAVEETLIVEVEASTETYRHLFDNHFRIHFNRRYDYLRCNRAERWRG